MMKRCTTNSLLPFFNQIENITAKARRKLLHEGKHVDDVLKEALSSNIRCNGVDHESNSENENENETSEDMNREIESNSFEDEYSVSGVLRDNREFENHISRLDNEKSCFDVFEPES